MLLNQYVALFPMQQNPSHHMRMNKSLKKGGLPEAKRGQRCIGEGLALDDAFAAEQTRVDGPTARPEHRQRDGERDHISTAPDSKNNVLSLAFGVFAVGLVIFGSMIIMSNLNHNMMPMDQILDMYKQR
jgi:hypothetical protein